MDPNAGHPSRDSKAPEIRLSFFLELQDARAAFFEFSNKMPPGQVANHPHLVARREAPVGVQRRGTRQGGGPRPQVARNRNRTFALFDAAGVDLRSLTSPHRDQFSTTDSGMRRLFRGLGAGGSCRGVVRGRYAK